MHGGPKAAWLAWRERRLARQNDGEIFTFQARGYRGSRTRRYLVHLPRGRAPKWPRPLVLVLHGCHQTHLDIMAISGFNRLADRRGFIVAYPFVTSYRGLRNRNCWGWWFEREIHAGAGEVEDLGRIIDEITERYPVDPRRIHVAGLSSGAGMAVAMMVAHSGRIASGAAIAGVPYSETARAVAHGLNPRPSYRPIESVVADMRAEMNPGTRLAPIQIVHASGDDKVLPEVALRLRDSWALCAGVDVEQPGRARRGMTRGTGWELRRYRGDGWRSAIETLLLDGPGHGWYGGPPGEFSFPDAPDISRYIWRFFATHPLERRLRPRETAPKI